MSSPKPVLESGSSVGTLPSPPPDNHFGPPGCPLPPMRTSYSLRSEHFYISALFTTYTNVLLEGKAAEAGSRLADASGETNAQGLTVWTRGQELEQDRRRHAEARTQEQRRGLGPGSWGGNETRLVHGDLGLLGRGTCSSSSCSFPVQAGPSSILSWSW